MRSLPNKRARETCAAILDLLDGMGIKGELVHRNKHPAVRFVVNDKEIVHVFPGSTSDAKRSRLNDIAQVKRAVMQARRINT